MKVCSWITTIKQKKNNGQTYNMYTQRRLRTPTGRCRTHCRQRKGNRQVPWVSGMPQGEEVHHLSGRCAEVHPHHHRGHPSGHLPSARGQHPAPHGPCPLCPRRHGQDLHIPHRGQQGGGISTAHAPMVQVH